MESSIFLTNYSKCIPNIIHCSENGVSSKLDEEIIVLYKVNFILYNYLLYHITQNFLFYQERTTLDQFNISLNTPLILSVFEFYFFTLIYFLKVLAFLKYQLIP